MSSRRTFLKRGAGFAAVHIASTTTPRSLQAIGQAALQPALDIRDPRIKTLAQRAIDTAISDGAKYADIRLTYTRKRNISADPRPVGDGANANFDDDEAMCVGIRALVDGYWGFAASTVWGPEEMVRLGREAVAIARTNALSKTREMTMAPVSVVREGHWATPIRVDPFEIYPPDIFDYMFGAGVQAARVPGSVGRPAYTSFQCVKQEKAFASSLGSFYTQCTYRSKGGFSLFCGELGQVQAMPAPAGLGFELFQDINAQDQLRTKIEEVKALRRIPVKPLDVGRYDCVFDATSIVGLLQGSIGVASELDRVLGYEANAGGTSYLNDPQSMLGSYQVGNSLLSVTANRNQPAGLATVQWDDEGVTPSSFPIVNNGVLSNYQTNREMAGWLHAQSAKTSNDMRSLGCAVSPTGLDVPLTHTANLVMKPGTQELGFTDLIGTVKKGIAFQWMSTMLDFQQVSGLGFEGIAFEIKDGKRTAILPRAGILFKSQEFWKNLTAIGGPSSTQLSEGMSSKGQPRQTTYCTVTTVPIAVRDVTVIDYMRKA